MLWACACACPPIAATQIVAAPANRSDQDMTVMKLFRRVWSGAPGI
jgi:hypothetical protein